MESDTGFYQPNLSVRPALEALLTRTGGRFDSQARQGRVLAAALMACAETGYANFTIADIAQRARVSTATIYAGYRDRDALLVAAIELVLEIVAQDVIELPDTQDPVRQVELLLIAHGAVYRDPLMIWILRMHVTLASSGHGHLHRIGRQVFEGIDRYWAAFLGGLVQAGHLQPLDPERAVPVILGPVERCTILARLACGPHHQPGPALETVARHAAHTLFAACGSASVQARLGASPAPLPPELAAGQPRDVPGALPPVPPPAAGGSQLELRLAAALAPTSERQSAADRRHRILLGAAAECQARGYRLASMVEAAGRSRASTATLYKMFADKADLFTSAVEQEGQPDVDRPLPAAPLAGQLDTLARELSDPQTAWIHSLIMASEIADTDRITALGRARWGALEQRLAARLPQTGDERMLAVNFLLGGIERTGVLGLILFGRPVVDTDQLQALCHAGAALWQAGAPQPARSATGATG